MLDTEHVRDILAGAVKAVDEAKVLDDLKPLAFGRAIDLLVQGLVPATRTPGSLAPGAPGTPAVTPAATGDLMGRLVAKLQLSADVVETIYTEHEGKLVLSLPHGKLAKGKSAGVKEIALLVCAAEQSVSDEPTASESIRKWAEEYDKYDQPNFSTTLAALKGQVLIGGTSRAKTYKLTKPGWGEEAKLVARIAGVAEA